MLIVRVRAPREGLSRAIRLAKGYVVGFRRDPDGQPISVDVVLRDPALAAEVGKDGAEVEVLFDSRNHRDPKDDVSKVNRYAEELERLKKQNLGRKPEA
jgi:hypothetical protein